MFRDQPMIFIGDFAAILANLRIQFRILMSETKTTK
jgi:hypothetical protein